MGGETTSVGLINVDKLTDEIAPLRALAVKELVKLILPSGAVRPVSVNHRTRVPGAVEFTTILLESNEPRGRFGVPSAVAWTVNELVGPQQTVKGRVTGLPVAGNNVVGGKIAGDSPPLIVIEFALASDVQSSGATTSAAAVRSVLLMLTF